MKLSKSNVFKISSRDEKKLFDEAIVVYDSSALLDFYGYSEKAKNEIFDLISAELDGRLWIPAQVKYEFLKNRETVITKPVNSYKNLISNQESKDGGYINKISSSLNTIKSKELKNIKGQIQTLIEQTIKDDKHPHIKQTSLNDISTLLERLNKEVDHFQNEFDKIKKRISAEIKVKERKIISVLKKDNLLLKLDKTFKIGQDYSYEKLCEIIKEGKFRYDNTIPPGYEDQEGKIGFQVYGDLILWLQTIDYAIEQGKPIIFITNDLKEDWWQEKSENTIPRHELIIEFNNKTNSHFWMYTGELFLHKANEYFKSNVGSSTLQELQDLSNEKYRKLEEEWLTLLEEAVYDEEEIMANHNYKYKGKALGTWLSNVSQDNKLGKKIELLKEIEDTGFDFKQRGQYGEAQAKRFIQKIILNEDISKIYCQNYFNSVLIKKKDEISKETKEELNVAWNIRFGEDRLWEKKSMIKDKVEEWKSYRYNKELNTKENWTPIQNHNKNLYKWVWTRKKDPKLLADFKDRFSEVEKEEMRNEGILI